MARVAISDTPPVQQTPVLASNAIAVAENRLLHALITNQTWFDDIRITKELFPHVMAQSFYEALVELKQAHADLTEYSILQQTVDRGTEVDKDIISVIYNYKEPQLTSIDDIITTLRTGAIQLAAADRLTQLAQKIGFIGAPVDDILQEYYELEKQLGYIKVGSTSTVLSYTEWLEEYKKDFAKRADAKKSYPFGDPIFDDMIIDGASPGDIGLISSATGQGKTTLVMHIFKCLVDIGVPTAFFSLEMGSTTVMDRKLAQQFEVDHKQFVNPTEAEFAVNKGYIQIVEDQAKTINHLGFSAYPYLNLQTLRDEIIQFQKKINATYCVIIVDLLSMVDDFCKVKSGTNMAQAIEIAMNQLSRIAKETGAHIIGTVQIGRNADSIKITTMEDIQFCRGSLNDLKNSNAYAERSRYVINVFRAKYYAQRYLPEDPLTAAMDDKLEFNVLKQNDGPVGRRYYMADMAKFHLYSIATEHGSLDGAKENAAESAAMAEMALLDT